MRSGLPVLRRAGVAVVLAVATAACSTQPTLDVPRAQVPTPAATAVAPGGPGTYRSEVNSTLGFPTVVSAIIGTNPRTPQGPQAVAAADFLRRAAVSLPQLAAAPRFLTVEIDNRGQVDTVPLPTVDVLDDKGVGASFRPAYDVVRETQELIDPEAPLSRAGFLLVRQLSLREDLVRAGQLERVPYISTDPLANVAQVIVNGAAARKQAP